MDADDSLTPCSRDRPCPICGGGAPCQASGGLAECCASERTGRALPAPAGYRLESERADPIRTAVYARTASPASPRSRGRAEEEFKEQQKRRAREVWTRAIAGHARIRGYLQGRGLEVVGELSDQLRYAEECYESWDAQARREVTWPAVVARIVELHERDGGIRLVPTGVHRIFLARERDAKRGDEHGAAKKMLGACGGRMVCLSRGWGRGAVIVTEGIETGYACQLATGWPVWAALSASYLRAFVARLPAGLFAPREDRPPPIHTVVFAADLNRRPLSAKAQAELVRTLVAEAGGFTADLRQIAAMPTGERWAWLAATDLWRRFPWVQVHVRTPTALLCPSLVESIDGRERPKAPSVDWLDVHVAAGAQAVREGVVGGIDLEASARAAQAHAMAPVRTPDPAPSSEPEGNGGQGDGGAPGDPTDGLMWYEDGEDRPCISRGALDRARLFLLQECVLPGAQRFRLVRWAGKFFWYEDGRWAELDEKVQLYGRIKPWLAQFNTVAYKKSGPDVQRLHPTARMVEEMIRDLAAEAFITVTSMPAWVPPSFDAEGRPQWGSAVRRFSAYRGPQDRDPGDWIVYRNGRLDARTLVTQRRVVLAPATPDLLTFAARPYPLDVELLERVLKEGFTEAIARKACPAFWRWLQDATADSAPEERDARIRCLQRMFGDSASGWRTIEKIFLVCGPKRAGKDLIQEALAASHGEETIGTTSFLELSDRFGLAPLVGKSLILMPDAHTAEFREGVAAVERLKTMSGNGRIAVRDLYTKAEPNVKIRGRFWIFVNDEPDKLPDNSGAFAGRLVVYPLTRSFYGREDLSLKPSVAGEGPGINLWALAGLVDLWSQGRQTIEAPPRGRQIQHEIERNSSPMSGFLEDCCVIGPDAECRFGEIYKTYETWCQRNDRRPVGRNKFIARLRPLIPQVDVVQPVEHTPTGDRRPRQVVGLTLLPYHEMPEEMWDQTDNGAGGFSSRPGVDEQRDIPF